MSQKSGSSSEGEGQPNQESTTYRCPYCPAEYDNELLTRVHITRSDDGGHEDADGFAPEVAVVELDSDGEVIGRRRPHPKDASKTTLDTDVFPEKFDSIQRRALLIAAYNSEDPPEELEDRINGALQERGKDKIPSQHIKRLVKQFYEPQNYDESEELEKEIETVEDHLRDLTPRQQSIIIGLANTDLTKARLAKNTVDVAKSYPTQIAQNRENLITRMETLLQDESIEDIIVNELTVENVMDLDDFAIEIAESDKEELSDIDSVEAYWSKLNVDWDKVLERKLEEKKAKPSQSGALTKRGMTASPYEGETRRQLDTEQEKESASLEDRVRRSSQPPTQSDLGTQDDVEEQRDSSGVFEDGQASSAQDTSPIDSETSEQREEEDSQDKSAEASSTEGQATRDDLEQSTTTKGIQQSTPARGSESVSEPDRPTQDATQPGGDKDTISQRDIGRIQDQVEFTLETLEDEIEMGNEGATRAAAVVRRIHTELNEQNRTGDQDTLARSEFKTLHNNLEFTLDTLEQEVEMGNKEATRATAIVSRLKMEFDDILSIEG